MSQAALALQPASAGEPLSARNFTRLAEFIHGYSGIKMPSNKKTMLEGRLRRRMRVNRFDNVNEYCRFIFDEGGLETETIHLIDAVTTNKTEFFREPAHFDFLIAKGLPALAAKAELARIGRYYATESMLVWDAAAGRYSAGDTPSTGSQTLGDFYADLLAGRTSKLASGQIHYD